MSVYDDIKKLYSESKLYNNEFKNYEDDFTFWKYWVEKLKPKSVLEIGIGNGRLIELLASKVDCYDGIEISKNIIADFKKKHPEFKGKIFNQDMKKIKIKKIYDLIIVPFNTFVYLFTFEDVINFFKGIRSVSNQSTIIIIDVFNPTINDLKNKKNYKLCNTFKIENYNYKLYERHFYDSSKQVITYQKKYISDSDEIILNLPVRVFFHQELLKLIYINGFEVIEYLGDYNNEKYYNKSRKQILFLKKRCN